MPTDMTIAISTERISRQDGVFSSPALRTAAVARADDVAAVDKKQDVEERQKLAAVEQELPPAERGEDSRRQRVARKPTRL